MISNVVVKDGRSEVENTLNPGFWNNSGHAARKTGVPEEIDAYFTSTGIFQEGTTRSVLKYSCDLKTVV